MSEYLLDINQRIVTEFAEIEQVIDRAGEAWSRYEASGEELFLDSVALNIHGFYNGLESVFETIALQVDKLRPQDTEWHKALLAQMARPIEGIRPAVISEDSWEILDKYRKFRHVVRHLYSIKFKPKDIEGAVQQVSEIFQQVKAELLAFADFLEANSKS